MGQYQLQLMEAIQRNPFGREAEMALQNGWVSPQALARARSGYSSSQAQQMQDSGQTFTSQQGVSSLRRGVEREGGGTRSGNFRRMASNAPTFHDYPDEIQNRIRGFTTDRFVQDSLNMPWLRSETMSRQLSQLAEDAARERITPEQYNRTLGRARAGTLRRGTTGQRRF